MDRFCRGCLVRYDEPAELLQYTEKNRRLFVYSTGLQVKRNDTFAFQLCKDCYLNMKVACSFKKQCRSSDKKLKGYSASKDTGETMDLSTYLKNNDDSWTFRFPMLYGSSTPAHQKPKDDDTESSTSIRNFMTDIMPETDLLETEARIIKEVIQEDADLLDESLDSHWLQDDVSIDTNFRLDFSFSPFSASRSGNSATSPSKLPQHNAIEKQNEHELNYASNNALDMPILENSSNNIIPSKTQNDCVFEEAIDPIKVVNDIIKQEIIDTDIIKLNCDNVGLNSINKFPEPELCTIDKNLEEALKNSNDNKFFLDELLVSPQVIPGMKSPPTPLINNILFGEKLDMTENSNNAHKYIPGLLIENYENVLGDIEMTGFDIDIKTEELELHGINTEIINEGEQKYVEETLPDKDLQKNVTNFYCKMCSKQFSNLKKLKRHAARLHRTQYTCDYCGKQFNDKTNFARHVQIHIRKNTNKKYECEKCKLTFSSQVTLRKHEDAHSGQIRVKKPNTLKKYMCTECGFSCNKRSNLAIHVNRHNKTYKFNCPECGKGYHRRSELVIHMRYHTGERPFRCNLCDRGFPRRDALTRHVKSHLEKPFVCEFCNSLFVTSNNLKNHHKKSKRCIKTRDTIVNEQDIVDQEESSKFVVAETTVDTLKANVPNAETLETSLD